MNSYPCHSCFMADRKLNRNSRSFVRERTENTRCNKLNMLHPKSKPTAPRLPREVNVTLEISRTVEKQTEREFVVLK